MRLSEAVSSFLVYQSTRKGRAATTINTYTRLLAQFVEFVGDKDVALLKLRDIDTYAASMGIQGNGAKTMHNKLSAVRSLVKWLYIKDLCDIRPEKIDLPIVKDNNDAVFMTREEAQRFMNVISDIRDRALMLTLLSTGLRVTEMSNVQFEDVHKGSIIVRHGKGDKARVSFMNQETRDTLQQYIKQRRGVDAGPLFPNPQGKTLSRQIIDRKVRRYAVLSKQQKQVTVHSLRHTFATGYLEDGGRLEDLQQLLGHENIRTTMIYLHFTNDRLRTGYQEAMPSHKYTLKPLLVLTHTHTQTMM